MPEDTDRTRSRTRTTAKHPEASHLALLLDRAQEDGHSTLEIAEALLSAVWTTHGTDGADETTQALNSGDRLFIDAFAHAIED